MSLLNTVVAFLKREPVAVWGTVAAVILGILPSLGVPASDLRYVGAALALAGIPVVRSQVSPAAALKALLAQRVASSNPPAAVKVLTPPARPVSPEPPSAA